MKAKRSGTDSLPIRDILTRPSHINTRGITAFGAVSAAGPTKTTSIIRLRGVAQL